VMTRKWLQCLCCWMFSVAFAPSAQPARGDEILVAAAASLTDALKDIGNSYQANSKYKVNFTFASSSTLARQIQEGAPADIFFSADLAQMDRIEKSGRLEPGTLKNFLSNQLVIIVPVDTRLAILSPADLLKADIKSVALAEPTSVPVGVYSSAYLRSLGLWDRIKRKIVPVLDARATLASVESGNVDAGFVYKTDAAISKKVRVAYEVPIDKGPRITYPVAVLKDSKMKTAARDFMHYLMSLAGRKVFTKYGFKVLE
jgi:molybdate transport system substrate-binding protein